jgi:hypothetical protein
VQLSTEADLVMDEFAHTMTVGYYEFFKMKEGYSRCILSPSKSIVGITCVWHHFVGIDVSFDLSTRSRAAGCMPARGAQKRTRPPYDG